MNISQPTTIKTTFDPIHTKACSFAVMKVAILTFLDLVCWQVCEYPADQGSCSAKMKHNIYQITTQSLQVLSLQK